MAQDPVCGESVEETKGNEQAQHQGRNYYFCSSECREEFQKQPDRYARQSA